MIKFALLLTLFVAANAKLYQVTGEHMERVFTGAEGDRNGEYVGLNKNFLFGKWIFDKAFVTSYGSIFLGGSWGHANDAVDFCKEGFSEEIPVIAPFARNSTIGQDVELSYYPNVTSSVLREINADIVGSFPAFEGLNLLYASVFTWQEQVCDIAYQAVLASDGVFSFVIFNYDEASSDKYRRCGDKRYIGFNNGYHNHQVTPMSCSHFLSGEVAGNSNIRLPGRYIFRVENVGLDMWAWSYYYLQLLGTWWIWTGVSLAFVVGIMLGLCCTACFACCASSSKKSTTHRRHVTPAAATHHHDIHIHAPPTYSPYPDDLIPPKY